VGKEGRIYMYVLAHNDMMRVDDEGSAYGLEEVGLADVARMAGTCQT